MPQVSRELLLEVELQKVNDVLENDESSNIDHSYVFLISLKIKSSNLGNSNTKFMLWES